MLTYTLKVYRGKSPQKQPKVYRLIEAAATHTLAELHDSIMEAFDRDNEGYSEFIVKGKTYLFPADDAGEFGDALFTDIASLNLAPGDTLRYLFDYRRGLWHVIEVTGVEERADWSEDEWPRVVVRQG